MLDLIARHEQYIKSFQVLLYEQEGELFRFKAELQFRDESKLFIKEYVFRSSARKYAYHWTDPSGSLICRWDNASHWTDISTFPHHRHLSSGIHESTETSLADVLNAITKNAL
jgi:hypothetical protein